MIILAGAPEPAKLDWSEKSLISVSNVSNVDPSTSNTSHDKPFKAQWRQLPADRLQMRPSLPKLAITPLTQINPDPADFFSPAEEIGQESPAAAGASDISGDESQPSGVSSAEPANEALTEYYDHSFTIYEAVPSSQLTDGSYTPGTPTYESAIVQFPDGTAVDSSARGGIIRTASQRRLSQAPRPKAISNLCDIPNANYLRSIEPQTKTVNLIVGVLSISATRKVTTGMAYGKPRQVELVELLVGDDTKTNFAITMWLPKELHVLWRDKQENNSPSHSPADVGRSLLRRQLKFIRPRDVLLLQNVALTTYKGKVAGASLRGEVTKVDLLYRKKIDETDEEGCYSNSNLRNPIDPQIKKVKSVRDWLVEFVGEDVGRKKGKKGVSRVIGGLRVPDDSQ
jgi:hypothetical protein